MKSKIIIGIFLVVTGQLYAQSFKGKVIDSHTNQGIPFISIGILNQSTGTVSNENGDFSIGLDDKFNNDTIIFESIGYTQKSLTVSGLKKALASNNTISLERGFYQLDSVNITGAKHLEYKTLGNRTENKTVEFSMSDSNDLGYEMGTLIKIKKPHTFIDSVSFFIEDNRCDTAIFRVNVYKYNKDGSVGTNMLNKNVIVKTTIKHGRVYADLTGYRVIANDNVIIALEYIKNQKKVTFPGTLFGKGGIYIRKVSVAQWEHASMFSFSLEAMVSYPK